jgi:hypothetical protein
LEQLHDLGVDISSGELSNLLTRKLDGFHEEKAEILSVGMAVSQVLHTDDTGARHAGKNGYCTHIGNELFAWFSSTESKSRIHFLECLSQGVERRYVLNEGALEYLAQQKLSSSKFALSGVIGFFLRSRWVFGEDDLIVKSEYLFGEVREPQ